MKQMTACFLLFWSVLGFAQVERDSLTAMTNPDIEKHQSKIDDYRVRLAALEEKIVGLRADAEHRKAVAEASSADNQRAASKLDNDVTSRRKARRARNAGDQAADDAKQARKAENRLKDAERDLEKLQSRIRSEEKKIEKLTKD